MQQVPMFFDGVENLNLEFGQETGTQWEVCEGGGWGCFQAFKTQNRWFSAVLAGWGEVGRGGVNTK